MGFCVSCSDGCILSIDDVCVIEHDEPHDYTDKAARVLLHEGWHHIRVQYTSFRHYKQMYLKCREGDARFGPFDAQLFCPPIKSDANEPPVCL